MQFTNDELVLIFKAMAAVSVDGDATYVLYNKIGNFLDANGAHPDFMPAIEVEAPVVEETKVKKSK